MAIDCAKGHLPLVAFSDAYWIVGTAQIELSEHLLVGAVQGLRGPAEKVNTLL